MKHSRTCHCEGCSGNCTDCKYICRCKPLEKYIVGESYYHIEIITAINRDECGICDKCEGALNTDTHVVCGYANGKKIWTKME